MVVEQLPSLDYNLHYEKSLYHLVRSYIYPRAGPGVQEE